MKEDKIKDINEAKNTPDIAKTLRGNFKVSVGSLRVEKNLLKFEIMGWDKKGNIIELDGSNSLTCRLQDFSPLVPDDEGDIIQQSICNAPTSPNFGQTIVQKFRKDIKEAILIFATDLIKQKYAKN